MNAFDVLSDPVRRRTLELISQKDHASGEIVAVVEAEFGITQSAVSQHLRILRDNGFAKVRKDGAKRWYEIDPSGFDAVKDWLDRLQDFWADKMDALATEIESGRRTDKALD